MDRYEATSKFFRSLVLVLLVYAVALTAQWEAFGLCVALALLSYWRFANQRWKFTEMAYLYFIELNVYRDVIEGKTGQETAGSLAKGTVA
jgi:hypothetical protein